MNQRHPFEFLPEALRRPLFYLFVGLSLLCFAVFGLLDRSLRNPVAPDGVVSFELAGSAPKAQAMLGSWDAPARLDAAFGLGFDFLFMPIYSMALSLAVLLALGRRGGFWPGWGRLLGWLVFAALLLDACENLALFAILRGAISESLPKLAALCAKMKFGLIGLGGLYALVGWWLPQKSS